MKKDSKGTGEWAELGFGIEEILRQGERRLIQQAVEAELSFVLEGLSGIHTVDSRQVVVRNGYQPERS